MPQLIDIHPDAKELSPEEQARHEGLFIDFRERIMKTIDQWREDHGFAGPAPTTNPIEGQTVVVNGLLEIGSLQAAVTGMISGDTLLDARVGLTQVFTQNYDLSVHRVFEAFERLNDADFEPLEGDVLAAAMITALASGAGLTYPKGKEAN